MKETEHIYWNDEVPTGAKFDTTTWYRVSPGFRDFYKMLLEKGIAIHGVVLSPDSMNFGFIISEPPPDVDKTNEKGK